MSNNTINPALRTTNPNLRALLAKHGIHIQEKQKKLLEAVEKALSNEEYYDANFGESVSKHIETPFNELTTRAYIASNIVTTSTNITPANDNQVGDIPMTIHPTVNMFLCNDTSGSGTEFCTVPRNQFKKRLNRYDFTSRWNHFNKKLAENRLYLKTSPSDGVRTGDSSGASPTVNIDTISKYLLFVRDVYHWYFNYVQFPPSTNPDGRFNRGTTDCNLYESQVDLYVEKMEDTLSHIMRDMALRDGCHSCSTISKVRELMNMNRWNTMTKEIANVVPQVTLMSTEADSKKYISSDPIDPKSTSKTNNTIAGWLRKMWQGCHSTDESKAFSTLSCIHCHQTVLEHDFFYDDFLSLLHQNCFVVASKIHPISGTRVICTVGADGADEGVIHLPFTQSVLFMVCKYLRQIFHNYDVTAELDVQGSQSRVILTTLEGTGSGTVTPPIRFADVTILLNQWAVEMQRHDENSINIGNLHAISSQMKWDFLFPNCKTEKQKVEVFAKDVFGGKDLSLSYQRVIESISDLVHERRESSGKIKNQNRDYSLVVDCGHAKKFDLRGYHKDKKVKRKFYTHTITWDSTTNMNLSSLVLRGMTKLQFSTVVCLGNIFSLGLHEALNGLLVTSAVTEPFQLYAPLSKSLLTTLMESVDVLRKLNIVVGFPSDEYLQVAVKDTKKNDADIIRLIRFLLEKIRGPKFKTFSVADIVTWDCVGDTVQTKYPDFFANNGRVSRSYGWLMFCSEPDDYVGPNLELPWVMYKPKTNSGTTTTPVAGATDPSDEDPDLNSSSSQTDELPPKVLFKTPKPNFMRNDCEVDSKKNPKRRTASIGGTPSKNRKKAKCQNGTKSTKVSVTELSGVGWCLKLPRALKSQTRPDTLNQIIFEAPDPVIKYPKFRVGEKVRVHCEITDDANNSSEAKGSGTVVSFTKKSVKDPQDPTKGVIAEYPCYVVEMDETNIERVIPYDGVHPVDDLTEPSLNTLSKLLELNAERKKVSPKRKPRGKKSTNTNN